MYKQKFFIVLAIFLVIFAAGTIVFAESDIKTHEYNFADKVFFNISDDLTNETEFKLSSGDSLDVGVYYIYPDDNAICSLYFVGEDGVTDFEGHQEDSSYEKIDSNATSQGYKTYLFRDSDGYDVFVELNNLAVDKGGIEIPYYYFSGSFESLDEAQIVIDTFKIDEKLINQ
ncbi:hypothetical protein [Methanobrevibacter sp.]|uniref:hypothetical protein n=1 Tax=Methanobrevibacter sp. TaxID=66852 RepID=UPI0026DF442E|nr:hypothetical protein [Methanobrevibacter sp.]